MATVFERIKTEGIAQVSYLIGDDGVQGAAVIDPRPDVDVYIDIARHYGVAITHIIETHIHADFMSGSRELARRLGGVPIYASVEGDASYGFDVEGVRDGDRFEIGNVRLTARHTPGHTPEHLAYMVEKKGMDGAWGVFTGDSLFVGSVGRPDLLGDEETETLTEELFRTLREFFLGLDDGIVILPGHGAGSECGPDIGDRPLSTIGYERRTNDFLQKEDFDEFKQFLEENAPPEPHHYRRLKKTNSDGPEVFGGLPPIRAMGAEQFRKAVRGTQLIDVRDILAFGGGHIEGAVNIAYRPELSVWAGHMLDAEKPILLIVENDRDVEGVQRLLVRTGFTRFAGYLAGGMKSWEMAGFELRTLTQTSVHELREQLDDVQVIDARAPDEWEEGHLPGARHIFTADLRNGTAKLDKVKKTSPVAVYCGSGYRASIAASIMEAKGFRDVRNVPGSWAAWKSAGYEVER